MNYQYMLRTLRFGPFIEPSRSFRVADDSVLDAKKRSKSLASQVEKYLDEGGKITRLDGFKSVRENKESERLPNPNAFVRRKNKPVKLSVQGLCQNKEIQAYLAKGYLRTKEFCALADCEEKQYRNNKRYLRTATKVGHILVTHKSDVETLWRILKKKKVSK